MSAATAQLTVAQWPNGIDETQTRVHIYGKCVLLTAGTYPALGVPLNWTATGTDPIADGNQNGAVPFLGNWGPDQTQPADAFFYSAGGEAATDQVGYGYVFDKTNNTLRITSGGTELSTGATITADTINFEAEFPKNAF